MPNARPIVKPKEPKSPTGFKRPVVPDLTKRNLRVYRDDWNQPNRIMQYGSEHRFKEVFFDELKKAPIKFLLGLRKNNPRIMMLGPGMGYDLLELYSFLNKRQIKPEIDVFGLTKSISEDTKSVVNNDFSMGVPLELMDPKKPEHKTFIDQVTNKYDLVVASVSVGMHTYYPSHNCYRSALMLNQGGEAYVQLNYTFKSQILTGNSKAKKEIIGLFQKLFANHNKQNGTNLKYSMEFVDPGLFARIFYPGVAQVYVRIKRLN